ncbi:MAG: Do family serine endopeptidase [Spirochaetales bacterium]|nr:Do family serine endopeptidase [Spirochaetales bacterium]
MTKFKDRIFKMFFFVALIMILSVSAVSCQGSNDTSIFPKDAEPQPAAAPVKIDLNDKTKIMYALQDTYRQVAKNVLPAVVEINVVEVIKQQIPNNGFSPWDLFGDNSPFGPSPFGNPNGGKNNKPQEREFRKQGLGSGVIVGESGNKHYVVTNNHVVGNADEISIRLYDGREFKGKIVGKDARIDLALVSFESNEKLPVLATSNSDELQAGDIVFAVGNPLGFESTITQGIISALGRRAGAGSQIASYTDYIQTDAAINPGNSGGALVNLDGKLIGLNTWIASQTGGSDGIGFAIPVNYVKKAVDEFINKGKITYGWLGVSITDLPEARYYNLAEDLKITNKTGAFVMNVFKGSPADKSGILPGDFITTVDNVDIKDSNHLTRVVGNVPPGTVKKMTVIRYGQEKTLDVRLDARQDDETITKSTNLWPGFFIVKITDDVRKQLEIPGNVNGVVLAGTVKGSSAETAGFREGDVITKVNNQNITTVLDFYKNLNAAGKTEITFRIYRGGSEILLGLVK